MNYTNENTEHNGVTVTCDINDEYIVEVCYSTYNDCELVERFTCKDREEVEDLLTVRYDITGFEYFIEYNNDYTMGHGAYSTDFIGDYDTKDFVNLGKCESIEEEVDILDKLSGRE